jgi:chorismate mutase
LAGTDASVPLVVAGPCSAESREQVMETALGLASTGKVQLLRAGLWKPRTKPQSFEGKGSEALPWLVEAKERTGLPIATEVATPAHVEECLAAGVDVLWIGARTTVSPFAVQDIAEALRGTRIPVFVKNPMHADLKLWIGAVERVQATTGGAVWAIHRGFSRYGLKEYRNAPMWEIPIGFRSEKPEIPLLCDPSHIAGRRNLLEQVAQKALDLGMRGLMVEVHPTPDQAWSDAEQQITPAALHTMLERLVVRDETLDPDLVSGLAAMRLQMDSLDEQWVELMGARMDLARQMGAFKKEHGLTVLQLERWREVFATRSQWATDRGLGQDFIFSVLEQIHNESIRVQTEGMRSGSAD